MKLGDIGGGAREHGGEGRLVRGSRLSRRPHGCGDGNPLRQHAPHSPTRGQFHQLTHLKIAAEINGSSLPGGTGVKLESSS